MARRILLIEIGSGLTLKGLIPSVALYGSQSGSVKADGGVPPYSYTITAGMLPGGVYLDRATGLVSGSPTEAGDFPITVKVTDLSGASIERAFLVKVIAEPLTLSGAAPDGTVGVGQSYTYAVAGGIPPYTYALVDAPPGWSVPDPSAPTIEYTAESGGSKTWTLRVTDSASNTFDKVDTAVFATPALTLTGAFANATIGVSYTSDLTIAGGDGIYINPRVTSGSLSGTGLTLSVVGDLLRLSGIPAAPAQTIDITLAVDSGDGQTATSDQSIEIVLGTVALLLHCDGANDSAVFVDSSGFSRSFTVVGDAKISTDRKKYGTASGHFDGSNDYIKTPYSSEQLGWWNSVFTIEAWVFLEDYASWFYSSTPTGMSTISVPAFVGNSEPNGDTNYWSFGPIDGGRLCFYYFNGSPVRVLGDAEAVVPLNQWTYIKMVHNGEGINLFVGDTGMTPAPVSGTPLDYSGSPLVIGQINLRSVKGNFCDLRIIHADTTSSGIPTAQLPNP